MKITGSAKGFSTHSGSGSGEEGRSRGLIRSGMIAGSGEGIRSDAGGGVLVFVGDAVRWINGDTS